MENNVNIAPVESTNNDTKCPSCGATLKFDPTTGGMVCEFCGRNVQLHHVITPPGTGYSIEELSNAQGHHLLQRSKVAECSSCGGKLLFTALDISGLCPFCGSNSVVMTEDTIGMLEPTGVVPFTISIDEARSIMHKWIGRSNFACKEKALMDKADKIFGVYVPYWVFDTDTYAFYQGKFGETRGSGDDAYTSWHKATGASTLNIRGLTVIASKRLEKDRYWSQISHFNMNMMKQYDPNLLSGFASERYTVDGMEAWGKAELNIVDMIKKDILLREHANTSDKLKFEPEFNNIRAKYCLAPVWITSFTYKNKYYSVLINGQTGDIVGTWPKSYKKLFLIIGIIVSAYYTFRFANIYINQFIEWLQNH